MNEEMIVAVDAAMAEMENIHPPLRRSECERLIRAAIAALDKHRAEKRKAHPAWADWPSPAGPSA